MALFMKGSWNFVDLPLIGDHPELLLLLISSLPDPEQDKDQGEQQDEAPDQDHLPDAGFGA